MTACPPWIDEEMPPRGPCGICGDDDARHRVIDAVTERVRAGDSVEMVAADLGLSEAFVRRLIAEGAVE